jgi:hypothetical protein
MRQVMTRRILTWSQTLGPRHPDVARSLVRLADDFARIGELVQPGDVAARPRKARDMAEALRVGMRREHDGDRLGRLTGGLHLRRRGREDDVDFQADQVRGSVGQPIRRFSRSKCNGDVLALDIAELA